MSKPRRPKRKVNGILLLDKPLGLSSNQALLRVRSLFQAEKAGHTGSLDPLATGLLPICLGQATKLCGQLLDSDKRYLATIAIGEKTTTGDAEGEVIARTDATTLQRSALEAILPQFIGVIAQVPPMYSALKHEGQRLYALARLGQEVAREPREVTIHDLRLVEFAPRQVVLDVRCSKGTYVRTLAEDIAGKLGQCAHLTALRRLEITPFSMPEMQTLAALESFAEQGLESLDRLLLPAAAAFAQWPAVRVDGDRAHYLSRGQAVRVVGAPKQGALAVFDQAGDVLCIAQINDDGLVAPRRWLCD